MATATVVPDSAVFRLMDKAVCIVLTKKKIGMVRTVSSERVKVKADNAMVHVTKDLFDSPELKAIISSDDKISSYLKKRCLPSPFNKKAVYYLAANLITEVDEKLKEHQALRQELIAEFIKVYVQAIEDAKTRLKLPEDGGLFDSADYLPVEAVRNEFYFGWQYVTFEASETLKSISQAMFDREQGKLQAQWAEASDLARQWMRARAAEVLNHMVTRLTPKPDGKKQVFRKTMMNNFNDFIKTFPDMNIGNDQELNTLVEKMKELTNGVSPEILKSDEALRNNTQVGFEKIKAQLDTMLTDAPTRSFRL